MVQIPLTSVGVRAAPIGPPPVPTAVVLDDPNEITDPMTGEIFDVRDIDSLISLYERRKVVNDQIYSVLVRIRLALANLTEGDAVTRRVRGKKRSAKIKMPDVSFEQAVLKELWNSHQKLALEYLKIETVGVRMKEYKKLVGTSSTEPDFIFFRDALTRAERGRVGTPSLTIEQ
jgi:hypothetical protein